MHGGEHGSWNRAGGGHQQNRFQQGRTEKQEKADSDICRHFSFFSGGPAGLYPLDGRVHDGISA